MNKKVNDYIEIRCNLCNKQYSSQSSLCNHNKKFHNNNNCNSIPIVSNNIPIVSESIPNVSIVNVDKNTCKICNKKYSSPQNRWKHEQKCKNNNQLSNELDKLNAENKQKELNIELIKEEIKLKKEESKILQLKIKLEKSTKVDNITLKKLNKLLLERNNRIKNSNINSNVNSNNVQNNYQTINNFQLIGFGKEEIIETLTDRDKKMILNSRYCSLEKLIEIVHCGKYKQFKNIIITNMKDNFMYKYDDNKGQFTLSTKTDVLNSLINYRIEDLEVIYNDLLEQNKLDEKTKDIIENFINKINYTDSKFTDSDGKQHENYKQYKINEIKVLLYNNADKITNDISLLLTTNEV